MAFIQNIAIYRSSISFLSQQTYFDSPLFFKSIKNYLLLYNFLLFASMNLIEELDAEFNENSLEVILGLQLSPSQDIPSSSEPYDPNTEQENCVTY